MNYNVALEDGRVVSGIIAEESANAISLKRAEGATDVIARDQIETIASTGVSLMPEGLEKGLSQQDLADLIAFVRSIRAPAATGHAAQAREMTWRIALTESRHRPASIAGIATAYKGGKSPLQVAAKHGQWNDSVGAGQCVEPAPALQKKRPGVSPAFSWNSSRFMRHWPAILARSGAAARTFEPSVR